MQQKYKVYINNGTEIITDNLESQFSDYMVVEAAGGVVYNNHKQLLMIFRNGKWDLPKGKLEIGENIRKCAIREVEEECGVSGLIINKQLEDTYHTYNISEQKILKRTYWFEMQTDFKGILTPESKEGIIKAVWVNESDVNEKIKNSFANIANLLG